MLTLAVVSVIALALLGFTPIATDTLVPWVSAWVMSVSSLPMTAWARTASPNRLLSSFTSTVAEEYASALLCITETPNRETPVPPASALTTGALTASKRIASAVKVLLFLSLLVSLTVSLPSTETADVLLSYTLAVFTTIAAAPTPTPMVLAATRPERSVSRLI